MFLPLETDLPRRLVGARAPHTSHGTRTSEEVHLDAHLAIAAARPQRPPLTLNEKRPASKPRARASGNCAKTSRIRSNDFVYVPGGSRRGWADRLRSIAITLSSASTPVSLS